MNTRRSSSVAIKAKTVLHEDCRRILDEVPKAPGNKQVQSPIKRGVTTPKKQLGKENQYQRNSSDEECAESDEDGLDDNDALVFHRRYFESAKRAKTSDNVLHMDKAELQAQIERAAKKSAPGQSYARYYDYWTLLMGQQYSIFLTGLGSKFEIMKTYRAHLEKAGYDTLFINGFLETTSEKAVLDAICADFIDTDNGESDQLKRILAHYTTDEAPLLFLFINNIESGGLSKAIYLLTKLIKLPKLKLICSIDKVYGPFVLDQNQFTSFNFLTFDVATFNPYYVETRQAGNLFAKGTSQVGLASLQHVFDSLTENGKGVLTLIIKEQITQISKQKDGPNFKELYKLCRKAFLVNSEVGLKAQLVELKDHRLIPDSNEQIRIQLATPQLEAFLQQNA